MQIFNRSELSKIFIAQIISITLCIITILYQLYYLSPKNGPINDEGE